MKSLCRWLESPCNSNGNHCHCGCRKPGIGSVDGGSDTRAPATDFWDPGPADLWTKSATRLMRCLPTQLTDNSAPLHRGRRPRYRKLVHLARPYSMSSFMTASHRVLSSSGVNFSFFQCPTSDLRTIVWLFGLVFSFTIYSFRLVISPVGLRDAGHKSLKVYSSTNKVNSLVSFKKII